MTDLRVTLVTGSSRGIGAAIARRLSEAGAAIVVNFKRDEQAAAEVVRLVIAGGGRATAVQGDSRRPDEVVALFDAAEQLYGGIDAVVLNAPGISLGSLADSTDSDFDRAFDVSARATFVAMREAATRMRDSGRIVFISSIATRIGDADQALYAAGKAAGEELVRKFAREVGPRGITVNSVLPGPTATDSLAHNAGHLFAEMAAKTPLGRIGQPKDIADVVAFLLSDDARWITGQSIAVDGGLSA